MPTGIEETISAAAAEVEALALQVLSIVCESAKQPKPDYNKGNSKNPEPRNGNIPQPSPRGKT